MIAAAAIAGPIAHAAGDAVDRGRLPLDIFGPLVLAVAWLLAVACNAAGSLINDCLAEHRWMYDHRYQCWAQAARWGAGSGARALPWGWSLAMAGALLALHRPPGAAAGAATLASAAGVITMAATAGALAGTAVLAAQRGRWIYVPRRIRLLALGTGFGVATLVAWQQLATFFALVS